MPYTIGVDFGTESGRALLVDVRDGREIATAVHAYANGVIDQHLPGSSKPLPPDWALQDPHDYLEVFRHTIPAVLKESGVDPAGVIGIGIDFTACTILPTRADGTPLSFLPEFRDQPHAWVKLWKHHAGQPQADQINETARRMGQTWLNRYGGKISSEWLFSKALQILQEAPAVYDASERIIEAADWVVWQLCGVETRNACTAGYKAMVQDGDYPPREYFAALDPRFADVVDTRMERTFARLGDRAGGLTAEWAAATGLREGIAVAVANVDAHVTAPAVKATKPGQMVMIMGTSTCHIMNSDRLGEVDGMCGVVPDGVVPGLFGYEAGQSGVGDIFAWFVNHAVPPEYHEAAKAAGLNLHEYLEREAAQQKPGEHGLLALDWWNGNRSVLTDASLSGMIVGMTLGTRAHEIYRALIEATAFGTRIIIDAFERSGVRVEQLVACGGLAERNRLLLQIYADVTGREFRVAGSGLTSALGAAMYGAVAAGSAGGGYDDIASAARAMGRFADEVYRPDPDRHRVYDDLFAEYLLLHDYFGRSGNDVMKRLRSISARAANAAVAAAGLSVK